MPEVESTYIEREAIGNCNAMIVISEGGMSLDNVSTSEEFCLKLLKGTIVHNEKLGENFHKLNSTHYAHKDKVFIPPINLF